MNPESSTVSDPWEPLADAMREELGECAHLLKLLEDQQAAMRSRRFVEAGNFDRDISRQLKRLQHLRRNSQALYSEYNDGADLARDREHWDQFLRDLPVGVGELFRALRQEMQQQFRRLQRLSRENLQLLSTAREAYGELLRRALPGQEQPAYDASGRSRAKYQIGARAFAALA